MVEKYLRDKCILVVDDEQEILNMVVSILEDGGYENTRTARNVKEALKCVEEKKPDFAILDVMLPDGNGFGLLEKLRKDSDYPILFLTARGEDEDKFKGFGLGADDYIVKPFLFIVNLNGCQIDFSRGEIVKDGEKISLTAKEYELLKTLYRNAGRIVTIDSLCEAIWGENAYVYSNSLMTHIRRIREKIEKEPSHPVSLITMKGLGYKLIVEGK